MDKTEPMDWKSFTQWREPNNASFNELSDLMKMPEMDWKHSTPIPRPVLSPIPLEIFQSAMARVMNKITKLFELLSLD